MVSIKIQPGRTAIGNQRRGELQLCVPSVSIDGESYRLKEAKERAAKRAAARTAGKKRRAASR